MLAMRNSFAGSVMARTFKAPMHELILPEHVPYQSHNQKRLMALDAFRQGYIQSGLEGINREFSKTYLLDKHDSSYEKIEALSDILDYHRDSALFKRSMRKIAKLLERMGL